MSTTRPSITAAASTNPWGAGVWLSAGRAANRTRASATLARGCIACFNTTADLLAAAGFRNATGTLIGGRALRISDDLPRGPPQGGNFGRISPLDRVRQQAGDGHAPLGPSHSRCGRFIARHSVRGAGAAEIWSRGGAGRI